MRTVDVESRKAFVLDIKTNFSLVAPAGVGKTQSVVQRILEIIRLTPEELPHLVVVTYTRRAAEEMRNRVYSELLDRNAPQKFFRAVGEVFFGTIHAFCSQLLRTYSSFLGLHSPLELTPNPAQLWREFLFSPAGERAVETGVKVLGEAGRYFCIQDLLSVPPPDAVPQQEVQPLPFPELDFSALLAEDRISESRDSSRQKVREGQNIAKQWLKKFQGDLPFLPLPSYSYGGKKFLAVWEATFSPLRRWVYTRGKQALDSIASQYERYRLQQGKILYSDQITTTARLLKHPQVNSLLRRQNLRVILDEAQDTDPVQFEILFTISGGRLTMVGDPQQSIYGDRASLQVYQRFRKLLCESPQSQELHYHVTFRCSTAIVGFVNQVGPEILHGQEGQATFIPLHPAYGKERGQVLHIPIDLQGKRTSPEDAKRLVAKEVADWLKKTDLRMLRARDWHNVAILCPRKRWLEALAVTLLEKGIPIQVYSEVPVLGSLPTYAWWSALFWVLAHPTDSFEIAGILREMFAVEDYELATLCKGDASRLHAVASAEFPPLRLLGSLAQLANTLPLRSVVEIAVRKTHLLERLLSLPGEDSSVRQRQHIELLAQASDAEARGITLGEFAQELRSSLESRTEMVPVRPNTVQLMTCHMAKGLEWDTVLVPYFYRKIPFQAIPVFFSFFKEKSLCQNRIHEMQRLLYVTLTRARNTLVIFDDCRCFSLSSTRTFSLARVLGKSGLQALKTLPQAISPTPSCPTTSTYLCSREQPALKGRASAIRPFWIKRARRLAFRFPKQLILHSSTSNLQEDSSDFIHPVFKNSSSYYDVWWHETAKLLPLQDLNWTSKLKETLPKCPDPERGYNEWKTFAQSGLARRLASRNCTLYREVTFFIPRRQEAIVEGIVDLAVLHRTQNRWLLVDWKTEKNIEESHSILERHCRQMEAYAHHTRTSTGGEVEAGFYMASLGQWVPIS
ncbi:UvrD-helicase domain-containing protein [Candidatus Xiphinematobacter sp. Idaho Grape]|uniref:UvrD-helicase domain-containing protein n=1 Tax=Candidatus Xiphinematobacter sp. Idaho Grape TaxID=1704307 RepID=UPI00078139A1|nr:UvrD-helicase domain-containing protein [Candidatus Xiphinematobacter sp. Idaho Grape]